jgi:hypothetical protein
MYYPFIFLNLLLWFHIYRREYWVVCEIHNVDAQFFDDDVVHLLSRDRVGQEIGLQRKKNKENQSVWWWARGEASMPKSIFEEENISNKKLERAIVAGITKILRYDLYFIGIKQ